MIRLFLLLAAVILLQILSGSEAFSPSRPFFSKASTCSTPLYNTEEDDVPSKPSSLEEKMSSWEASEDEIKAATLGGVVPGRNDAFDVGLYIAFPLMVASCLLFAAFPFIMGNIDTSSVGPPPTI
jgi:hypothetical protein